MCLCRSAQIQLLKDILTHVCGPPPSASTSGADGAPEDEASALEGREGVDSSESRMSPDNLDTQISVDMAEAAFEEEAGFSDATTLVLDGMPLSAGDLELAVEDTLTPACAASCGTLEYCRL